MVTAVDARAKSKDCLAAYFKNTPLASCHFGATLISVSISSLFNTFCLHSAFYFRKSGEELFQRDFFSSILSRDYKSRVQSGQCSCEIRWMHREAKVSPEYTVMIPVVAFGGEAVVSSIEPAGKIFEKIPAPNILSQITADGCHVANLWRRDLLSQPGRGSETFLSITPSSLNSLLW